MFSQELVFTLLAKDELTHESKNVFQESFFLETEYFILVCLLDVLLMMRCVVLFVFVGIISHHHNTHLSCENFNFVATQPVNAFKL